MKIEAVKEDWGKGFGVYGARGNFSFIVYIQFWDITITIRIPDQRKVKKRR